MSKSLLPSAPLERLIFSEDTSDGLKGLRLLRDRYLKLDMPNAASAVDALIGTTAVDQTESILSEGDNGTEKV